MSSNNKLKQDKEVIKQVVIKKIQDLRLKARDEDEFAVVKSIKKKLKKYEDFLNLLESGLPIDSFSEFDFHSL